MVTLKESIEIPAPYERLLDWIDNFSEEFVKWSPCHLTCQLPDGGIFPGARVRFREIVEGVDYDVSGKIVSAEQGNGHFCVIFASGGGMARIEFAGEKTAKGCRFSHTETFGLSETILAPLVNALVFQVLCRKACNWELIRRDMLRDNRYLYDILTTGRYPAGGNSDAGHQEGAR